MKKTDELSKPAPSDPVVSTEDNAATITEQVVTEPKVELKEGVLTIADVWPRCSISDICQLISRQQELYKKRSYHRPNQFLARNLNLLNSVYIGSEYDRAVLREEGIATGNRSSLFISAEVKKLQGISKLKKFIPGVDYLPEILQSAQAIPSKISSPSALELSRCLVDKILLLRKEEILQKLRAKETRSAEELKAKLQPFRVEPVLKSTLDERDSKPRAYGYDSSGALETKEQSIPVIDSIREITSFTTRGNLKHMVIGDSGAQQLADVLAHDMIIRDLTLAGARIGSTGAICLAGSIRSMKELVALDLSGNCITDDGAVSIAESLVNTVSPLARLSLAGNRITLPAAIELVLAALNYSKSSGRAFWMSLQNNSLSELDLQSLRKLLEEHSTDSNISTFPIHHKAKESDDGEPMDSSNVKATDSIRQRSHSSLPSEDSIGRMANIPGPNADRKPSVRIVF